jgi:hypothetical protein
MFFIITTLTASNPASLPLLIPFGMPLIVYSFDIHTLSSHVTKMIFLLHYKVNDCNIPTYFPGYNLLHSSIQAYISYVMYFHTSEITATSECKEHKAICHCMKFVLSCISFATHLQNHSVI